MESKKKFHVLIFWILIAARIEAARAVHVKPSRPLEPWEILLSPSSGLSFPAWPCSDSGFVMSEEGGLEEFDEFFSNLDILCLSFLISTQYYFFLTSNIS